MLNYLKAELYKVLRQRWYCLGLGLFLLCEGALLTALGLTKNWEFSTSVGFICAALPVGFFLVFLLASAVYGDLHKHQTLKNELSFGLPRARVYLGKLLAAALVCFLASAAAVGLAVGLGWALDPGTRGEELTAALSILGYCLLTALPLWLGALGLHCLLEFTIKSSMVSAFLYGGYFLLFEPLVTLFTEFENGGLTRAARLVKGALLSPPLGRLSGPLGPELLGWAWVVGLGWLVVTTLLGLTFFHRRDIK